MEKNTQQVPITHLVILCHGLGGKSSDWDSVMKVWKPYFAKEDPAIHLHTAHSYRNKTFTGIDAIGKLVATEIKHVREQQKIEGKIKLSCLGHSLGGLVLRYALGELNKENFFLENFEPHVFMTFATPHCGSRRSTSSSFNSLISWVTRSFISKTGRQLMLEDTIEEFDNRPLLQAMADPNMYFWKALAAFKYRYLYANVQYDLTVPYCTAAIVPRNIYKEKLHKGGLKRSHSTGHKKQHSNGSIDKDDKKGPTVNEDEIRTDPKYPHIIANRLEFQIEDENRKLSENAIDAGGFEAESLTEEYSEELDKEVSEASTTTTSKEDLNKNNSNTLSNNRNINNSASSSSSKNSNENNAAVTTAVEKTTVKTDPNGTTTTVVEKDVYAKFYVKDSKGDALRSILSGLRKLEWIRFDVLFTSALHIAHRQIICQTGTGLPGHDIVEHAKDTFAATLHVNK